MGDINVIRLKLTGLTRDHRKQHLTIQQQTEYLNRIKTDMLMCFAKAHIPRSNRPSTDDALADGEKTPKVSKSPPKGGNNASSSPPQSAKKLAITNSPRSPNGKQDVKNTQIVPVDSANNSLRNNAALVLEYTGPSVSVALANYSATNNADRPLLTLHQTKDLKNAVADLFRTYVADEDDALQRAISRTGRLPPAALSGLSVVRNASNKYSSSGAVGGEESEEANDALARCKYLEKTIESLKDQLRKDAELHKSENLKAMKENKILLGEINALRRHHQMLAHEINKPDDENDSESDIGDDLERFSPTLLAD
eukprot:GDKK01071904.1.p1 GENE.GDKK01071904.1~~GDKK01071904.1.p1  ORF type:complete len:311 (+),score=77.62 GDKK01071904.1:1-933(+)